MSSAGLISVIDNVFAFILVPPPEIWLALLESDLILLIVQLSIVEKYSQV